MGGFSGGAWDPVCIADQISLIQGFEVPVDMKLRSIAVVFSNSLPSRMQNYSREQKDRFRQP